MEGSENKVSLSHHRPSHNEEARPAQVATSLSRGIPTVWEDGSCRRFVQILQRRTTDSFSRCRWLEDFTSYLECLSSDPTVDLRLTLKGSKAQRENDNQNLPNVWFVVRLLFRLSTVATGLSETISTVSLFSWSITLNDYLWNVEKWITFKDGFTDSSSVDDTKQPQWKCI